MNNDDITEYRFVACMNPKGEDNDKSTTYLTDSEIDNLVKIGDLKGLPIHINHNKIDVVTGENLVSAGEITNVYKDKNSGKLHAMFSLKDTPTGRFAFELIMGENGKGGWREVSAGIAIGFNNGKITSKVPIELSICEKGERNGTKLHKILTPVQRSLNRSKKYINKIVNSRRKDTISGNLINKLISYKNL